MSESGVRHGSSIQKTAPGRLAGRTFSRTPPKGATFELRPHGGRSRWQCHSAWPVTHQGSAAASSREQQPWHASRPISPGPTKDSVPCRKVWDPQTTPPPPKKPDALSRQDVIQQSVHPVCAGHLLRCPALLRPRDAAASKAKLMTRALQSRRQTLFYKNHINTSLLRALSREKKGKRTGNGVRCFRKLSGVD